MSLDYIISRIQLSRRHLWKTRLIGGGSDYPIIFFIYHMFWGGRHSNKFDNTICLCPRGLDSKVNDWSNRSSLPNGNHVQSTRQLWWGKGRLSQPTVRTHQATKFTAPKCLLSETLQQISAVAKLSITNYTWAMLWNIRRKHCWWKTKTDHFDRTITLLVLFMAVLVGNIAKQFENLTRMFLVYLICLFAL